MHQRHRQTHSYTTRRINRTVATVNHKRTITESLLYAVRMYNAGWLIPFVDKRVGGK